MILHGVWQHDGHAYNVALGTLGQLAIERADRPNLAGAIARGTVDRVLPGDRNGSRQAFVKLPGGATGFLQGRGLQPGQAKLVQVAGWVGDGKAWPLSTELKLPGRNYIYLPQGSGITHSKTLTPGDTVRLSVELTATFASAPPGGWIIRSGALHDRPEQRQAEARALVAHANQIADNNEGWLVAAPTVADRVALDEPDDQRQTLDLDAIDERLQPLLARDIPLKSGGRIRLGPTPALCAIDVDGGTTDNAGMLGAEAAATILQAIRTRAIAGQIVIDPVRGPAAKALLATLKELATPADRLTLHGITRMGLIELSRPRVGPSLFEALS